MYAYETPILESVFMDLAPNAGDIAELAYVGLPTDAVGSTHWHYVGLRYSELAEWADEPTHCLGCTLRVDYDHAYHTCGEWLELSVDEWLIPWVGIDPLVEGR